MADLEKSRGWVKGHFTDDADAKYQPIEGKLRLLEAILDNKWIEANETWKLQSLGVAFGDAVAQKLMLDWVVVEDEYGRSSALNWPGTKVYSYPITMISKRVEAGEAVDVRALFADICDRLCQMAFSGESL